MKKFVAIVMALALVCSLGTTAFAAEITQDSEQNSSQAEIVYNLETSYCVWIPETLEASAGPYTFMASQMNLDDDEQVTIRLSGIDEYSYIYLQGTNGDTLQCVVEYDHMLIGTWETVAEFTDSLTANGQLVIRPSTNSAHRTGYYSGTFEFVVSVDERIIRP